MPNIPRQILKNTTALAAAQVATLFASFVLVFFLARSLGVVGLGVFATVMSFYGVAADFCAAGVRNLLVREIARDLSQTNRYMIHAAILTAAISLVGMAILGVLVVQLKYSPQTTTGVWVVSLALIPATWMAIYETVFVAHQKAEYLLYTSLLTTFGRIGVSIYLLRSGHGILSLFVALLVFVYIAFFLQTFLLARNIVVPHWEFDWPFAWKMLKELRTFTALGFLSSIFSQIEILLLSVLRNESAVGIYSAASKLTIMWFVIPWSYMRAAFPLMAQASITSRADFQRIIDKSLKYLLALALPLAIGTAVLANEIIRLFYGSGFEEAVPVLRWLGLLLIPMFVNEVLWRILIARDEQHLALRAQMIAIATKVGVSFLAVPFLGYMGTVIAMIATQAIHLTVHIVLVRRGGTLLPLARLTWRFGLAAVLMGGVSWLLGLRFNFFIIVPVAVAFYGLFVIGLRAFSSDDLTLFGKLVGWPRLIALSSRRSKAQV